MSEVSHCFQSTLTLVGTPVLDKQGICPPGHRVMLIQLNCQCSKLQSTTFYNQSQSLLTRVSCLAQITFVTHGTSKHCVFVCCWWGNSPSESQVSYLACVLDDPVSRNHGSLKSCITHTQKHNVCMWLCMQNGKCMHTQIYTELRNLPHSRDIY